MSASMMPYIWQTLWSRDYRCWTPHTCAASVAILVLGASWVAGGRHGRSHLGGFRLRFARNNKSGADCVEQRLKFAKTAAGVMLECCKRAEHST